MELVLRPGDVRTLMQSCRQFTGLMPMGGPPGKEGIGLEHGREPFLGVVAGFAQLDEAIEMTPTWRSCQASSIVSTSGKYL